MLPRRPSPTLWPSGRIEPIELCPVFSNGLRHSIVVHQKDGFGDVQKPQGKGWRETNPPPSSHIAKFRTNAGTIAVPAATARDHLGKLQTRYLSLYFLFFLNTVPAVLSSRPFTKRPHFNSRYSTPRSSQISRCLLSTPSPVFGCLLLWRALHPVYACVQMSCMGFLKYRVLHGPGH